MITNADTQAAPSAATDGDCRPGLSLSGLVGRLESLRAAPAFGDLRRWLGETAVGAEELRPYVAFRPGTYVRTRVLRSEHTELLVLCWRPGHYTSIHDHNGSYSVIRVISGLLHETIYDYDDRAGLRLTESHEWSPGHVTTADIPDIHRIGNAEASGRDLVTLHCYAPPFDSIRTYKLGSTETGTLVPEAPREV
jgi:cysteine dioxygenase